MTGVQTCALPICFPVTIRHLFPSHDTGKSRGGVSDQWENLISRINRLLRDNKVEIIGVWSHFARADEPAESMNKEQLELFMKKVEELRDKEIKPALIHIANSAAAITNKES